MVAAEFLHPAAGGQLRIGPPGPGFRPLRLCLVRLGGVRLLMVRMPDPEQGHEVGAAISKFRMGLVRLLFLVQRSLPRVLDTERGNQDDHFIEGPLLLAFNQHACQAGVQRKLCHHAPDGGQSTMAVDGSQLPQDSEGVFYGGGRGRVQEGKVLDASQPQEEHPQDHFRQVGAQDFRRGMQGPGKIVVPGVQADADSGLNPPAAALPLIGAGPGNGNDGKALSPGSGVVLGNAGHPGIDHIPNARDGDGCFRHVCGHHDLFFRAELKDALLIGCGQAPKHGQDNGLPVPLLFEPLDRFPDVALGRHENENVSVALCIVPCFEEVHSDHGLIDVACVILFIGHLKRPVPDFHRIGAAGNLEDGGLIESTGEFLRIERGRSDDHFQVRPLRQDLPDHAENEINVDAAFMGLIDNERVVGTEQPVFLSFRQKDAVGHELDASGPGSAILEPDLVAHPGRGDVFQFFRDAVGKGYGGDAPRLGAPDPAFGASTGFDAHLGELRAFSRPGFPGDNDHLVGDNGLDDLFPFFDNGKIGRVGDRERAIACEVHGD